MRTKKLGLVLKPEEMPGFGQTVKCTPLALQPPEPH